MNLKPTTGVDGSEMSTGISSCYSGRGHLSFMFGQSGAMTNSYVYQLSQSQIKPAICLSLLLNDDDSGTFQSRVQSIWLYIIS